MKEVTWKELQGLARTHGRTYFEEQSQCLYMNWTCSGVELCFRGTCLMAEFTAVAGAEEEVVASRQASADGKIAWKQEQRKTWPWIAVFVDDEEEPSRKLELFTEKSTQLIWLHPTEETHRIRIVKLTENLKTMTGICRLFMDGELLPQESGDQGQKKRIEFIGDSITCGFGNESNERDRLFYAEDENGWMSHGAIAGRMLGMDWSLISSSGICIARRKALPHAYSMEELYLYTDRILEETLLSQGEMSGSQNKLRPWEFGKNPSDYVVLNLGTNDGSAIRMSENPLQEELDFQEDYLRFLQLLRAQNGPDTRIICALGSIDYFLYASIEKTVERYRKLTKDERIWCFRYPGIDMRDPLGACGHPHWITQVKMADTLVKWMREMFSDLRE